MNDNVVLPEPVASGSGGRPGRRRTGLIAAAAAASVVVVGGTVLAARSLGGGGPQPSDVLPAETMLYGRVDMDPSVGQKIAAFRLLDKLPEAKKALGDADPKRALFDLIARDNRGLRGIDYRTDIQPWLGDRVGVAVLEPAEQGSDPAVAVAVQVKDEAAANAGIDKLERISAESLSELRRQLPDPPRIGGNLPLGAAALPAGATRPAAQVQPTGRALLAWPRTAPVQADASVQLARIFRDSYLVLTEKKHEQRVRQAMDRGNLAGRAEFVEDMAVVGEPGVSSWWVDQSKLSGMALSGVDQSMPRAAQDLLRRLFQGRQAFAVRVTPEAFEMVSYRHDNDPIGVGPMPAADLSGLPADTAAVVSFTKGGAIVGRMWTELRAVLTESAGKSIDPEMAELEQRTGLRLPEDVQTLLGEQFDVVVSEKAATEGGQRMPRLGVRVKTDTARAETLVARVSRLLAAPGSDGVSLPQTTKDGRFLVALDRAYLDELTGGTGLTADPTMSAAVPDLGRQSMVAYVNLDKLEQYYLDAVPADNRELVRALKAVGISMAPADGGTLSTMRVLVN